MGEDECELECERECDGTMRVKLEGGGEDADASLSTGGLNAHHTSLGTRCAYNDKALILGGSLMD